MKVENHQQALTMRRFLNRPPIAPDIVSDFFSERPAWMGDAVCASVDPDLFFPENGQPAGPAKAVCAGCPARLACLEYAVVNDCRAGVWGGLSERERRGITRSIRRGAA